LWIQAEEADAARRAGYTVVDPVSVLSTHLSELIRTHAHELFNRQDAKRLLDRVAEENPRVVEDLVPKLVPLATIQRVLQNLLRERVSIRDGASILESLSEAATVTRNPVLLSEYVRQTLRRSVAKPYLDAKGELPAFLLDPELEQRLEQSVEHGENTSHMNLAPMALREITDKVMRTTGSTHGQVAVLASAGARYFLRQMLEGQAPNVAVLGHGEIPPGVHVVSLGLVH
jgi:flagellar biosynthesis protein FlhA